jgi:hypothetical protein
MRLTAPIAARAAAVGLVIGAIAAPASLAHATAPHARAGTGPSVTVTPNTNVKNGETVSVSGSGFPPNQSPLYVIECSGTTSQSNCDTSTLNFSGSTDDQGSFSNVTVVVHTGTVGDGTCKAGGTCYIAASTSTSPDSTNSAFTTFTFAKATRHPTKTTAKFASKTDKIVGTVKSAGKGVKGLTIKLKKRAHGHWKTVQTLTTHKGGKFKSAKIKHNGKYQVKTPKQKKYAGSKSKVVKVRL